MRHVVENPGRVRRLTAAIVVNDRLTQPAAKDKAAVWQPRSADELRNLTALAQAAVGFDATRGDMLTVEDLAFDDNRPQPPVAVPRAVVERRRRTRRCWSSIAALLAGAAGGGGIRRAARARACRCGTGSARTARRAGSAKLPAAAAAAAQSTLKPPEPAEMDPERMRTQEIFEQVTTHLKREPTQSSRLLQSWIHSD